MMSKVRFSLPLGALAVAALLIPASASAGVHQGKYACYGEGNIFISSLKIKSATKYNYLGEGGKYVYHAGPKVLRFTNGPLKPWVGHYDKVSGDPFIKLVTDKHGGQTVNCYG
jgi:hypothetical protein